MIAEKEKDGARIVRTEAWTLTAKAKGKGRAVVAVEDSEGGCARMSLDAEGVAALIRTLSVLNGQMGAGQ